MQDIVAQGERYVEAVYTQEHSHSYSPGYLTESLQEIQGNMSCTRALDLETVLCCIHQVIQPCSSPVSLLCLSMQHLPSLHPWPRLFRGR